MTLSASKNRQSMGLERDHFVDGTGGLTGLS